MGEIPISFYEPDSYSPILKQLDKQDQFLPSENLKDKRELYLKRRPKEFDNSDSRRKFYLRKESNEFDNLTNVESKTQDIKEITLIFDTIHILNSVSKGDYSEYVLTSLTHLIESQFLKNKSIRNKLQEYIKLLTELEEENKQDKFLFAVPKVIEGLQNMCDTTEQMLVESVTPINIDLSQITTKKGFNLFYINNLKGIRHSYISPNGICYKLKDDVKHYSFAGKVINEKGWIQVTGNEWGGSPSRGDGLILYVINLMESRFDGKLENFLKYYMVEDINYFIQVEPRSKEIWETYGYEVK